MAVKQPIREVKTHPMAGIPPLGYASWTAFAESIPLYPIVDIESIKLNDPTPFFVTLDILQVGATSENGLFYSQALVDSILSQLPGKGGTWGHTHSFEFVPDAIDWVGHTTIYQEGKAIVYAKMYVPPGRDREYVRRVMQRGGKLKTSLQGWGEQEAISDQTYTLNQFVLEKLDVMGEHQTALKRVQVGYLHASQESIKRKDKAMQPNPVTLADVPSEVREQIIRESQGTADLQPVTELNQPLTEAHARIRTLESQLTERDARIVALESTVSDRTATIATLETDLTSLRGQVAQLEHTAFEHRLTQTLQGFTAGWTVRTEVGQKQVAVLQSHFRRAVLAKLGDSRDTTHLKTVAEGVWQEDIQPLADSILSSLSGGNAFVAPASPKEHLGLSTTQIDAMANRFLPKK